MRAVPDADADVAAAYDGRAREYIALAGAIEQTDARDRELIGSWRDTTPGILLDAGCGPGQWTAFLAQGGRQARGMDLSAAFVAAAQAAHPSLRFDVGSFRALPVADGVLGGILAWYSLIHLPPADMPAVLAESARALAPGGSLLIGFFDGEPRERFAHAVAPAYFWSADALSGLLDVAGFTLTSSDRRERVPGEPSTRPHGAVTAIRR